MADNVITFIWVSLIVSWWVMETMFDWLWLVNPGVNPGQYAGYDDGKYWELIIIDNGDWGLSKEWQTLVWSCFGVSCDGLFDTLPFHGAGNSEIVSFKQLVVFLFPQNDWSTDKHSIFWENSTLSRRKTSDVNHELLWVYVCQHHQRSCFIVGKPLVTWQYHSYEYVDILKICEPFPMSRIHYRLELCARLVLRFCPSTRQMLIHYTQQILSLPVSTTKNL